MSSDSELHALVEAGLFGDAAKKIDQQQDPITSVRVLRAQLEAHVGTPHNARALAQKLLREKLTHKDKCLCWELIGRACLSVGQLDDGLRAMTRAFNESAETQDLQVEARLQSSYVHALLAWVGTEPALLEIPKLRHIAVRAGDPYSMIAFHYLVASIDARKGLTKSALASVEIARDLLNRFDNLWQRGRLAIVCYGVSMFQADYESALNWNREAIECARRSGSRELTIPALANLAFVKFSQNELEDARSALSELIHELKKGGLSIAEIGVRDIEMRIAIAAEDLDGAAAVDDYITNLISEVGGKDSYYDLWHSLIRVKWFYRKSRPHDGVAIAVDVLPRIARAGDRILLQRMKLLAAEGYGRINQPERGAALMAAAVVENPDNSLELAAEVFRVAGRLTAHDNPGGALKHFDRAWRTFDGIGNFAGRAEVERDCQEILGQSPLVDFEQHGADKLEATRSISVPADLRTPIAPLTERIAALVETGTHVPLLATGILSLLADTNSVQFGVIVATHRNGRRECLHSFSSTGPSAAPADHPDAVRIEIGHHQDLNYEIVTLPLPTASARATVLSIERLTYTAVAFAQARQREREQSALWREPTPEKQLGLICASDRMIDLVKTIRRVADSNVTVLLTGETGVGKELFARALHQASSRSEKTFLPFNCSTVPRDMFDSQLFGHRRGSFTGAHEDSAGVIRAAAGGTLFLDEIGEMSLDVQPKLLRFLESGEVQPLGDPKPKFVDVRVVAATNANLDQLVGEGRFREDLFYRLNVIRINVPPLRERREEIPAMVEHFLEKFGRELQKPMLRIADETLEYLVLYRWPGNVRQLANEIRRLVAMAEPGSVLMPAHLSDEIASSRRTVPATAPQPRQSTEVVTRIDQPLSAAVEHIERAAIQRAITLADGRLDDAAKMLGLSRKGLYLKRQRLNLE